MPNYRDAIASIESGGDYSLRGPVTSSGDRAYGKYQVMGSNVGPWTEQVLGRRLTPEQFLASPEAQDAVFDAIFGGYVQRYGPSGAAQAWFAGPGSIGRAGAGMRSDQLGTTVDSYVNRFNRALGGVPSFGGMGGSQRQAPMPTPTNARERVANFIQQAPLANMINDNQMARAAGGQPLLERMQANQQSRAAGGMPILENIKARRMERGLATPLIDAIMAKRGATPQAPPFGQEMPQTPVGYPPTSEPQGLPIRAPEPSQPVRTANLPSFDLGSYLGQRNPMGANTPMAALMDPPQAPPTDPWSALRAGQPYVPPGPYSPMFTNTPQVRDASNMLPMMNNPDAVRALMGW